MLGGCYARCQGPVALDGAVPAGSAHLGGRGEDTGGMQDRKSYLQVERDLKMIFCAPHACLPCPVTSVDASGQVVIAIVSPRVVEEIRSGAETMAVDHPSWSLTGLQKHTPSKGTALDDKRPAISLLLSGVFTRFWLGLWTLKKTTTRLVGSSSQKNRMIPNTM